MNLIILHPNEIEAEGRVQLSGSRATHIRTVLRAPVGKVLKVGLLNGPLGEGTVLSADENAVSIQCVFSTEIPAIPKVDLLLAMPRPKVMKRLWAQLATLGVGRIILVNASKVERYYFDSHVLEPEFYTPLLIEGLQQARCTRLPEVLIRRRFKPFIEDEFSELAAGSLCLLADPSASQTLPDLSSLIAPSDRVLLAVGPEGGWDPFEIDLLQQQGFSPFSFGKRILRTDTACVGLLSSIHHLI